MKDKILAFALENAVRFSGKANPGAVIGKLISEDPGVKKKLKEIQPEIQAIVKEVNAMSPDEQRQKLDEINPDHGKKQEKEKKDVFDTLHIQADKIITAFPPGPEKYPHIGHAKAILLNFLLAKKFDGKFILRFEDTNPMLVKDEFYEIMEENFTWLGVKWDELIFASDNMDLFYKHAQKLLEEGKAYMCTCSQEEVSVSRKKSVPCACRSLAMTKQIDRWDQFKIKKEGETILRLKIDLEHKNSTMRDPTIMRIIDKKHARHGTKYRIWPNYDFQNAIMDGESGITHRIRSKEFEMRDELQAHIQTILDYDTTKIYSIGRFNLEGVESSGRIIRDKIENKELIGWDDPTLTTIVALRRRGFLPDAIKNFVVSTGISKAEATLTWDDLFVHNRRLLDASADRFFFVPEPVEISIENAPIVEAEHKVHPDHPERGIRKMISKKDFLIMRSDLESFSSGNLYRLMDCLNFMVEGDRMIFDSLDYEKFKNSGEKILHYLPETVDLVKVDVMMPDKSIISGLAENKVKDMPKGEIVQFERFGFCRLDEIKDNKYLFWFTHK